MPTIECLGHRRWLATVDGEPIGEYPRRSIAEHAVARHVARRTRRRALSRNAALLCGSILTGFLSVILLSPGWAVPFIVVAAYGVWRSLAGMESASTDKAWVYRDQIYQ